MNRVKGIIPLWEREGETLVNIVPQKRKRQLSPHAVRRNCGISRAKANQNLPFPIFNVRFVDKALKIGYNKINLRCTEFGINAIHVIKSGAYVRGDRQGLNFGKSDASRRGTHLLKAG